MVADGGVDDILRKFMKKIKLTKEWWFSVLSEVARKIRVRARDDSKNADGRTFNAYSDPYKKYKGNDFRRFKDGKRLKSVKGVSISSNQTSPPDMTATGKTLSELQATHITTSGGRVSFPTMGNIVKYLAKVKNFKIVNVGKKDLIPIENKWFKSQLDKKIKKELKRNSVKKTVRVQM